ncbi:class I SAM-dependent methyltransferase [Polyangium sp. y55x31]|uniref:class I SAM-dependent methyltransferase n=1 Tax=Polyangium sp. y55x31 TaxID=3042688 RepID=UPI0024830961|nr:class I SAM-dependent methyltransferase [Polyangium sp. y55x31]MDI1483262.1 methyltransferase domain-containing protein [Polyangium sp. y55x31]
MNTNGTKNPVSMMETLAHWHFRRIEECSTLLQWLDPRPGERVLDIGCGDGYYDARIAERGAHVVGVDIHEKRLAKAQRKHRSERTDYHYMDAEELGFSPSSFDKVISFCVIEHFRNEDRVLEHVHRVLRPGGRLFLSADSLSNPEVTDAEREAHRRRYAVNNFYTVDHLREKLERAGLILERYHYILTTPITLALARLSWKLDDLPPFLMPLHGIGYAALGTVGKVISDFAEDHARRPDSGLTLLAEARRA